jgi:CysZ protein
VHTVSTFFGGLLYPMRALRLIADNRRLWSYILVPLLINILLGILLYAGLFTAGTAAIEQILAGLNSDVLPVLRGFLQALLLIVLFVAIGFVLVRFGVLLGSPWYGKLSESLEQTLTGSAPPAQPLTLAGISYDLWRSLGFEIKKLLLFFALWLPLLLFNFVPGFGQLIVSGGSIALGAFIACLDFLDPPLERRRLRFRVKIAHVRRGMPASAGFGLICFGLVSVPFLNLLAIPLCITAGTLFFCERLLPSATEIG